MEEAKRCLSQHSLTSSPLLGGLPWASKHRRGAHREWLALWRGDAVPCIPLSLFGIAMDLSVLPALETASPACP